MSYNCTVNSFEVHEKKPRGRLKVTIGPGSSGPMTSKPAPQTFHLDEDSDASFAGMASICAARLVGGANSVKIQVLSGAEDEIDMLSAP
jgi:hypothetical protein